MPGFRNRQYGEQSRADYYSSSSPAITTTAAVYTAAATPSQSTEPQSSNATKNKDEDEDIINRVSKVLTLEELNQAIIVRNSQFTTEKEDTQGLTHVVLRTHTQIPVVPKSSYTFEMTVNEKRASDNSKGFGLIDSIESKEFLYNKDYPTKHTVGGFSAPIGTTCQITMILCDPSINTGVNITNPADSKLIVCVPGVTEECFHFDLVKEQKSFMGKSLTFSFYAVEESHTFIFWIEEESNDTIPTNPFSAIIYANYI